MNTLLNYPGAKWGMAAQIVSLMPPHRSYLEPFFGSGAEFIAMVDISAVICANM